MSWKLRVVRWMVGNVRWIGGKVAWIDEKARWIVGILLRCGVVLLCAVIMPVVTLGDLLLRLILFWSLWLPEWFARALLNVSDRLLPDFWNGCTGFRFAWSRVFDVGRFWCRLMSRGLRFALRGPKRVDQQRQSVAPSARVADLEHPNGKRFILVISGPPASGKSFLLRAIRRAREDIECHEMDDIRQQILPGLLHDKASRSAAYRVMHFLATQQLSKGGPVALCATYMPAEHRAEIADLVSRLRIRLYVVQCVCAPDEAAKRFQRRRDGHAGADLTGMRVKQLSEHYERFDGALLVDTTSNACPATRAVDQYVLHGSSVDPIKWARHPYSTHRSIPASEIATTSDLPKLSEASVRAAKASLLRYALGWGGLMILTALSIIPLAYTMWTHFRGLRSEAGERSLEAWSTWATFCLALAGFWSIVLAIKRDMRKSKEEARRVKTAGYTSRYQVVAEATPPSDKETYHSYLCRIPKEEETRIPIQNVPIFFQELPASRTSFAVLARSSPDLPYDFSGEAAKFGLDWNGFVTWRQKARREQYAITYSREYGLRCVGLTTDYKQTRVLYLSAVKCSYDEYTCRELAVNHCAPGILPDMRRLFEGAVWDAGKLVLLNVAESAKRYSMRVSTTGLVLTADDYFILQRRSSVVGHGLGSLAASVNGAADYYADRCDDQSGIWSMLGKAYAVLPYALHQPISIMEPDGPASWDLAKSALREIREEIGLMDKVFQKSALEDRDVPPFERPFIAAAYNLRYGRDLNFYCCFRTSLRSDEISAHRKYARDKWEVENLVFLHRDEVTRAAFKSGSLERALPNRARHLLGALYAWAVYADRS